MPTNLQPVEDLLRNQLRNYLINKATEALLAKFSFLTFGPLSYLTGLFVTKVIDVVIDQSVLGMMIAYIRFDVDSQVDDIQKLVEEMKSKIDKKELTDAARKELNDKLIEAGTDLIRLFNKH